MPPDLTINNKDTIMKPKNGYLIFKSGGGYYRAKARGYTIEASEAGRFSYDDAVAYSHPNGPNGPRDGITFKHESEVRSDETCEKDLRIHALTVERDIMQEGQNVLVQDLNKAMQRIQKLEAEKRGSEYALEFIAKTYA
jgi:hypothetical protein